MFVRYQTARNVALVVAGLGGAALVYAVATAEPSDEPAVVSAALPQDKPAEEPRAAVPAAAVPVRLTSSSTAPQPVVVAPEGVDPMARVLVAAMQAATPKKKRKDALGRGSWKLNLYEDTGDAQYDRFKLDKDRDGVWDEAWSFKDGGWSQDGAAKAALEPKPQARPELGPVGVGQLAQLLKLAEALPVLQASGKKQKDYYRGSGPKVNLYDDDQDGRWDRVKVDLERDETWDESWTVKGGEVERRVTASGVVYLFRAGSWVPKK